MNKDHLEKQMTTGFTLVELLVVIVIMAILMSVAIPAFQGLSQKGMKSAVSPLTSTLRLARQYAVTHRTKVWIVFPDAGTNLYGGVNKPEVEKAYRAYAVIATNASRGQLEYITDWKYLPQGIYFNASNVGDLVMASVGNPGSDTDFPFPAEESDVGPIPAIMFAPNGHAHRFADPAWTDGLYTHIDLVNAVVPVDASNGAVNGYTYLSSTGITVEVRNKTGQLKVEYYE